MSLLVLLRHGQSQYNLENRFTGWLDVSLTEQGRQEAQAASSTLAQISFECCFCSRLGRAEATLAAILGRQRLQTSPTKDSALNERHYGRLQGLPKDEVASQLGQVQVRLWRRDYFVRPPGGESLEDCERRTLPFFLQYVLPQAQAGRNTLVVAHGNSLRPILKYLDMLTPETIAVQEIPFCVPFYYIFNGRQYVRSSS